MYLYSIKIQKAYESVISQITFSLILVICIILLTIKKALKLQTKSIYVLAFFLARAASTKSKVERMSGLPSIIATSCSK